ncbi:hypothetical protein Tco_0598413 [Tanacetum coccineum]
MMSLDAHQGKGEGECAMLDLERAIKLSLDPAFLPQGRAPVGGVTIRDLVSETIPKCLNSSGFDNEREIEAAASKGDNDQGESDSSTVTSRSKHTCYTNVSSRDNPESHSGSMSSMKNLEDTDNFGDQFLYDKPTEDDQEKSKVVDESDSTIPDPSPQTITSTPPVIAPVIDFSSPKPSSLVTPPPINTEATTITTSLPEITPFIALHMKMPWIRRLKTGLKTTKESMTVMMIKRMMIKRMMMMKPLQLDQTRVSQQKGEDTIQVLLGQLNLLQNMMSKVRRNHGSLMHLLPNNIQLLPQTGSQITESVMLVLTLPMHRSVPTNRKKKLCKADLKVQLSTLEKLGNWLKDFSLFKYNKGMETRDRGQRDDKRRRMLLHCDRKRIRSGGSSKSRSFVGAE